MEGPSFKKEKKDRLCKGLCRKKKKNVVGGSFASEKKDTAQNDLQDARKKEVRRPFPKDHPLRKLNLKGVRKQKEKLTPKGKVLLLSGGGGKRTGKKRENREKG